MKILISAVACSPYQGSEPYFGWSAIKCLAQDHQICVITSVRGKPAIDRAYAESLVPPGVRFFYAGRVKPFHPNRMLARIQDWKDYIYFAKDSLNVARELHRVEKFDLVQHITYSTFRVPSPMWQLGIPFVFGPISGNETFPFRLFNTLSPAGAAFELARKTSNVIARFSPSVRRSIRRANHVFVGNQESEHLIQRIRGSNEGVSLLSAGFYSPEWMAGFSRFASGKNTDGMLRLYVAGNLGGHKCVAIALHALFRVKQRGVDFRYLLGAGGPEIVHLKKLVAKLGLTQEVIFGENTSREAYQQELHRTHIYLLPSLRESVGLTMLEAMLAGCVPIVADNGGPRLTVKEDCGYKIPITTPSRMADEIADIIVAIDRDRKIISEKGAKASKRVAVHSAEENYRKTVNAVYLSVTSQKESNKNM